MLSINILPYDVLQIIITSGWEEKGESFAITASHVCRWWRRHVLDMPLLWNRLEFATRVPEWDMLETKLERSGRAPLHIVVNEEVFKKSGMPHLRRIMRMIVPHIERWRSVRMVDVPHKIRRVLLDQLRGKSVPDLNRVEVVQGAKYDRSWGRRIKSTSPHWDPRKIFEGIPNLRHVEWANSEAEYRLLPPFRNLLTLKIGPGTLEIEAEQLIHLVFHILSASPALRVLSLSHGRECQDHWRRYDADVEYLVQPPATHSSLELLHIVAATGVRSAILRSLILPKLRSLGGPILDTDINVACCKTLAHSGSASGLRAVLISAKLDGAHVDPHLHMPSLPSAIMKFQRLAVLIFRFIDFGGNNKWLPDLGQCCPDLKSLALLCCTGYTVRAVQAIVEIRMKCEELKSLEELRLCAMQQDYAANDEEVTWFSERVVVFNSRARGWVEINGYDPWVD